LKTKILYLSIFFFTQIATSQTNIGNSTSEGEKLVAEALKALAENNFGLAKELYIKATNINPDNKDLWFNLAVAELNLNENTNACENLYKAYLLDDSEAAKLIKKYCPDFRNGTIMSLNEVEEKPKFIYKGKESLLFDETNNLSSTYRKILVAELKKSRILKEKAKGNIIIQININKYNVFDGKIIKVEAEEKDKEAVKKEILSILRNMVTYTSAKNKGNNVDLWEKFNLPIILK